jgi:hypothetical protein
MFWYLVIHQSRTEVLLLFKVTAPNQEVVRMDEDVRGNSPSQKCFLLKQNPDWMLSLFRDPRSSVNLFVGRYVLNRDIEPSIIISTGG